jgi:GNAT superfamily N-acetyltransferase
MQCNFSNFATLLFFFNKTTNMIIRKAVKEDSKAIATLLLLAMEDIVYQFINQNNYETALDFMLHFVQKENNQYSHENCFVTEENGQVVAAVNLYDGAKLQLLRTPVINYVRVHYNKDFSPEDETQTGEYYIDTLGVLPSQQGKGIGSCLLSFLIDQYVKQSHHTLGLLVEENNPGAKMLYLKLGFCVVGTKTLVGKKLEHLQINPSSLLFGR